MSPSRRLPSLICIRSSTDSPFALEPIRYGLIVNCEDFCKGNVSTTRIPSPTLSTCIRQQSPTASAVQRLLSIWTPRKAAKAPCSAFSLANQGRGRRSEEHTSELQSRLHLVCRL